MKAELLKALKAKAPEETQAVEKWVKDVEARNLAVLGEDQCFKIADETGEIKAFSTNVKLSEAAGTLVPAFFGGPMIVSASGYGKVKEAAGAICMKAPTLFFEGEEVKNPHYVLHPETGRTVKVVCRMVAFRYTNKGIPEVSDRVAVLDIPSYRMTILVAKAKKFPQAFKLLPTGISPAKDSDNEAWAKYPFDESVCMWLEVSHEEVLGFYKQLVNIEKKAVEICQTFAERNALKHLFNLPKVSKNTNTLALPVICWRPLKGSVIKWDPAQYVNAQITLGAIAEQRALDAGSIEITAIKTGIDDIDDDAEAQVVIEDEAPDETEPEKAPTEEEKPSRDPGPVPDKEKPAEEKPKEHGIKGNEKTSGVQKQLDATKTAMPEYYEAAKNNLGIDDQLLTKKEATAMMKEINRLVDKDNAE